MAWCSCTSAVAVVWRLRFVREPVKSAFLVAFLSSYVFIALYLNQGILCASEVASTSCSLRLRRGGVEVAEQFRRAFQILFWLPLVVR